jgi:hypothetical protein
MRRRIAFIAAVALFLAAVGGVGAVARSRNNLLNTLNTFAAPAQESTMVLSLWESRSLPWESMPVSLWESTTIPWETETMRISYSTEDAKQVLPYADETTSAWVPGPGETQEPPALTWHAAPYLPDSYTRAHAADGFPGFAGVWSRVDADGQMIDARLSCWDMRTERALYAPDTRAVRLTITNMNDQNLLWYGEEVFVLQYWDGGVWETCQPKDSNLVLQAHEQALAKGETKATFPLGEYALPGEGYYRIHTSIDVVSPKGYPYQLFSIFEISSGGALTLSEASAARLIREPW